MEGRSHFTRRRIVIVIILLTLCILVFLAISNWSAIGTKLANPMRQVFGVRAVAQMETFLFGIQDRIDGLKYKIGLSEPDVPWSLTTAPVQIKTTNITISETAISSPIAPETTQADVQEVTDIPKTELVTGSPVVSTPSPTAIITSTPEHWNLVDVPSFGNLQGEGVWQPYIYDSSGDVVALRTFLQPDPERPYTLVAVVAFNLVKTDLHFVLGLKEPSKPGGPHGNGVIRPEDKEPGKLLAAFNGGFIAEHGNYGAMADGVTALAARAGLATLVIYEDGEIRIGEWGKDFYVDEKYEAWRQNALMIIHNGEINPKVETGTWVEWGANLDGATVTLRSSVGISEDNQVLYYFAGPNLSMPVLADAMLAGGVYNGMLLDINPTHAHFTAMRVVDGDIVAEPLYEEEMDLWIDRYIGQWGQDFFYVTTKE